MTDLRIRVKAKTEGAAMRRARWEARTEGWTVLDVISTIHERQWQWLVAMVVTPR